MATRTPPLQTRSQFGESWGDFAAEDQLPNAPSAPLSAALFPILEVGDFAYSQGRKYVCASPGTAGGGDALWRRVAALYDVEARQLYAP